MARYAPGLPKSELEKMTREETDLVQKLVIGLLKDEQGAQLQHTKAIVRASGARLVL